MYLWFSFAMFIVGGVMALIIRAELFEPGLQVGPQDAGETAELLALHRVALVGHRGRPLLALRERLLHFADLRLLEATNLERTFLER